LDIFELHDDITMTIVVINSKVQLFLIVIFQR